jgi:hypothetical protein
MAKAGLKMPILSSLTLSRPTVTVLSNLRFRMEKDDAASPEGSRRLYL